MVVERVVVMVVVVVVVVWEVGQQGVRRWESTPCENNLSLRSYTRPPPTPPPRRLPRASLGFVNGSLLCCQRRDLFFFSSSTRPS